MKFPIPESQWRWLIDASSPHLRLDLGEGEPIATGLKVKNLRDKDFMSVAFSVTDTQLYNELAESLELSELLENEGFAFWVLLNAVAVSLYHKEVAAKNWLYQSNSAGQSALFVERQLASVQSKIATSDVLLLQQEGDFFHCLLLQPLTLDELKQLPIFALIKVTHDRLFTFTGDCLNQFG